MWTSMMYVSMYDWQRSALGSDFRHRLTKINNVCILCTKDSCPTTVLWKQPLSCNVLAGTDITQKLVQKWSTEIARPIHLILYGWRACKIVSGNGPQPLVNFQSFRLVQRFLCKHSLLNCHLLNHQCDAWKVYITTSVHFGPSQYAPEQHRPDKDFKNWWGFHAVCSLCPTTTLTAWRSMSKLGLEEKSVTGQISKEKESGERTQISSPDTLNCCQSWGKYDFFSIRINTKGS